MEAARVRIVWVVILSAIVLKQMKSSFMKKEVGTCPRPKDLRALGCSCSILPKGSERSFVCNAARWNADTAARFAIIAGYAEKNSFQFRGKLKWETAKSNGSSEELERVITSPFTALCGSNVQSLKLLHFTYAGEPPHCNFASLEFDDVSIDFPTFFSTAKPSQLRVLNQKNFTGLENLSGVKDLRIHNSSLDAYTNFRLMTDLRILAIEASDLQTQRLDFIPKRSNSLHLVQIRDCKIRSISADLWSAAPHLQHLDLANNEIESLPEDPNQRDTRPSLFLAGNPLNCEKLDWTRGRVIRNPTWQADSIPQCYPRN
ncbi:uncharacterized protein LOC100898672 [Galendromus occidentalis]|uniref:Uncharacterized protein LOC100898672 n=1 Tax=Galendromus occidentalis TaxID=34638 RepID=A0AAJ6QN03_9ACAR|nr:uncharacterized protein LOC100898672 [Galendromus occidentalis]